MIPLSIPNISGNEEQYVLEALRSQWVSTAGGYIVEFEKKFANYLELEGACACQSGTAGLHLCLEHFGIGEGDRVIVPTLTFIAPINAVRYQKAVPVFFDCLENFCIDVRQVEEYIETQCIWDGQELKEKESGSRVKAIIPVHVFGEPCDMEMIMDIADRYRLIVIEDATESLGTRLDKGKYKGKYTGTIGHAGVFSFNGNKIITTGGGGMIVSKNQEALEHMRYLSQQAKDNMMYFIHNEVGYNYRMTNLQAAVGLGQLERIDEFINIKQKWFKLYEKLLENCPWGMIQKFEVGENANHWFYSFKLYKESEETRDRLIKYLEEQGIQTRPIWHLNHLQKPYKQFKAMPCHKAENALKRTINIPCSTNLTEEEVRRVAFAISSFR